MCSGVAGKVTQRGTVPPFKIDFPTRCTMHKSTFQQLAAKEYPSGLNLFCWLSEKAIGLGYSVLHVWRDADLYCRGYGNPVE